MIEAKFPEVIDNSMRKELVKCETAAKYRYEMGLRPVEGDERVDLIAGKAFASGLEAARKAFYAEGKMSVDALTAGVRALYAEYGSYIPSGKTNKTVERMAGALAFYLAEHPMETERYRPLLLPDGHWAIEVQEQFDLPIDHPETGKPLVLAGRFDMLAVDSEDPDSGVWVVDEKTTSQMGEKWANQWLLDSQMTTYCYLAKVLLMRYDITLEVKGAIVNGIAIRLRDYEVGRFPVYRPDWMVERWFEQFVMDVSRWRTAFLIGQHNMALDHACAFYNNPCQYVPLCSSRNPERIIETSFAVKRWNPVTREDEFDI